MTRIVQSLIVGMLIVAFSITSALGFSAESDRGGRTRVEREVRHELAMLPYYSAFDNLAFRVDDGTVTLLGQVTRPTLKSDAENVVKRIEGVERVINKIDVLPPSPEDDRIRIATYRAIYGDPALVFCPVNN